MNHFTSALQAREYVTVLLAQQAAELPRLRSSVVAARDQGDNFRAAHALLDLGVAKEQMNIYFYALREVVSEMDELGLE